MAKKDSSSTPVSQLFKTNRESFGFKLSQSIYPAVAEVAGKRALSQREIEWEHPLRQSQGKSDHGDYASNLAFKAFGKEKKTAERKTPRMAAGIEGGKSIDTPWDLANAIVNAWRMKGLPDWLAKVEVVKPGFINVWLKNEVLIAQLIEVLNQKDKFGSSDIGRGKKILLEHTSPNPQTTIMLGHLRNNFIGMTMSRVWAFSGAEVKKDCIVNDRGVHLCRAIWGYLVFGQKRVGLKKDELLDFRKVSDAKLKKAFKGVNWQDLLLKWAKGKSNWWQPEDLAKKPDYANLIWYVLGSRAYKLDPDVKNQVGEMVVAWEQADKNLRQVWRRILGWSEKGYAETYRKIGSHHDHYWRESDHWQAGKKFVEIGLKKGIFKESQKAVVTDFAGYDLPDTVVQKADGTGLYHTQDLALTKLKVKRFPSDLYVWDIGVEQTLYLKQLFLMCDRLGIAEKDDLFHLSHALVNFKGKGKMATRTGDVVMADEILDEIYQRALKIIKKSNQELRSKLTSGQLDELAQAVALGALKYGLLKFGRGTTMQYDIDESLALEGNSGPYLQYTYARAMSVLEKAKAKGKEGSLSDGRETNLLQGRNMNFESEELQLLRTLYRFPEVVEEVARRLEPNLICNFLYDLAQKYNYFYNQRPILKASHPELVEFRLGLSAATAQILKNGLKLLGISAPEKM